jgi:hypothetical protein
MFVPTDDYLTAFETRYQHTFDLQFPVSWRQAGGMMAFAQKWTARINLSNHFKTTSSQAGERLNPFKRQFLEEDVLFALSRNQYGLFYNRLGTGLGWEGSYTRAARKQLLNNGFEFGDLQDWVSLTRWRFNETYTVQFRNRNGIQTNRSDFLLNRNVDIFMYALGPELIWQPTRSLRLIGGYELRVKHNRLGDVGERAEVDEWHGNLTWNQLGKGTMSADLRLINIQYSGEPNLYVAYQMLEALQPGRNVNWRLNWQQALSSGLQMTLQYNGRTSEGQAPIHTGTVVMTAYF